MKSQKLIWQGWQGLNQRAVRCFARLIFWEMSGDDDSHLGNYLSSKNSTIPLLWILSLTKNKKYVNKFILKTISQSFSEKLGNKGRELLMRKKLYRFIIRLQLTYFPSLKMCMQIIE